MSKTAKIIALSLHALAALMVVLSGIHLPDAMPMIVGAYAACVFAVGFIILVFLKDSSAQNVMTESEELKLLRDFLLCNFDISDRAEARTGDVLRFSFVHKVDYQTLNISDQDASQLVYIFLRECWEDRGVYPCDLFDWDILADDGGQNCKREERHRALADAYVQAFRQHTGWRPSNF